MKTNTRTPWRLLLLSAMLVLALGTFASASFQDVPEDSYYAQAVDWAVSIGVTKGTGENTFSPERICTRGQVVTFLWRAKGCPEPKTRVNVFEDVASGSYCEQAVLWAVENGITNGTSATAFSPERPCAYSHIITFLWRASGSPEPKFPSHLTGDWPESYYKKAVTWGDNQALFEDEGDSFDPSAPCSRAKTVTWLHRAATVYVDNVRDLMNAIGPGREIYLDPGTYNLTEWAAYIMEGQPWSTGNPYVTLERESDGWEVRIAGVKNLGIYAAQPDGDKTEIVTAPRYADVLTFADCSGIVLGSLTLGHTPEQGSCSGAVLNFEKCGTVAMSKLDLYGCGTYGVTGSQVDSIQMRECVIHECTYGLMDLSGVGELRCTEVTCRDCKGYTMLDLRGCVADFSACTFENCVWEPEFFRFLGEDEDSLIRFADCAFSRDILENITGSALYNKNVFVTGPQIL